MSNQEPQNPYENTSSAVSDTEIGRLVCENCGGAEFTRVKPESGFAFAKDYLCVGCNEQIPAPVPLWGRILMIVCGSVLALFGLLWVVVNLGRPFAMLIGGAMLYFGGRSAVAGFR